LNNSAVTPRILVIVPAFNEAASLPALVASLRRLHPHLQVLIVDDGSEDQTAEVAERLCEGRAVRLISLPCNLGVGGAVQTGLLYARRESYDIAIQVDGDGQHPPSEISSLLAAMHDAHYDLVIGSRFLPIAQGGAASSAYQPTIARRLGTRMFSSLLSALCGTRITDATSGFRAFSRRAIALLAARYPEDYPEVETILMLAQAGMRIGEVPVRMERRASGASSIGAWEAITYMIKVPLAILMALLRKNHSELS